MAVREGIDSRSCGNRNHVLQDFELAMVDRSNVVPEPVVASGAAVVPPAWRMPEGVDRALWAYTHEPRLAEDEESYFAGHPLLAADVPRVLAALGPNSTVADLGCGTGRAALALARAGEGHRVVAVDLSRPMLERLLRTAHAERLAVLPVEANLCDLRALAPGRFDALLLLFSTLGMIRGRAARRRVLAGAARLANPTRDSCCTPITSGTTWAIPMAGAGWAAISVHSCSAARSRVIDR
jgi:SAM-dependent methyltransferase